jgi:UDP-glucose:(heptosyl)LPS alpha-1,3-glucosyltransferase
MTQRPKVALVALSADDTGRTAGGTERACAQLLRNARADVDFVVLADALAPDLQGAVEWRRVRLPAHPAALRDVLFFVVGGWKLRSIKADVTHATGAIIPNRVSLSTVHYCHAAYRAKVGSRFDREGPLLRRLNTALHRLVAEAAERWVYRPDRAARLAAVSVGVANELHSYFPRVDIVVVPNGVDVVRFHPDPDGRRNLRGETMTPDDELVALFVGGDWSRKGLEVAIGSIGLARAAGMNVSLWVVGRGDERRFGALAESNGVADAVRFFGRRTDTQRFYAAADLFLLPSAYETFSLVAYEAAATGLPVIGTNVSGIAELIGDGGGGILVDATPESVLSALRALDDPSRRLTCGQLGRAWAQAFTWETSARATVEIYRRFSGVLKGAEE